MSRDALELVRQSPRALAEHGTARLWMHVRTFDEEEDEWYDTFEGEGGIEFARLRFRLSDEAAGEGGRYFWRGSVDGGWTVRGEPENPLDALTPFWLIELVRGAVSASELDAGGEAGDGPVGYSCVFDLVAADRSSEHRLAVPGTFAIAELLAIPGEAWLDSVGCLRGASCRLPSAETRLKLDDLGGPEPIELPAHAKQIW